MDSPRSVASALSRSTRPLGALLCASAAAAYREAAHVGRMLVVIGGIFNEAVDVLKGAIFNRQIADGRRSAKATIADAREREVREVQMIGTALQTECVRADIVIFSVANNLRRHRRARFAVHATNAHRRVDASAIGDPDRFVDDIRAALGRNQDLATRACARNEIVQIGDACGVSPVATISLTVRSHIEHARAPRRARTGGRQGQSGDQSAAGKAH